MNNKKIAQNTNIWFSVLASLVALGYLFVRNDDLERRNDIPYTKKMRLIDKETINREPEWEAFFDEAGYSSRTCSKLSFDIDGNTNTTEVVAFPVFYSGIKEAELLNLGEEKTLREWDDTFRKKSQEVYDTHQRIEQSKSWYQRGYMPAPDDGLHYLVYKKLSESVNERSE